MADVAGAATEEGEVKAPVLISRTLGSYWQRGYGDCKRSPSPLGMLAGLFLYMIKLLRYFCVVI